MKLSTTQQKAIEGLKDEGWHSAYKLRVSLSTLDALRKKGLVEFKQTLGSGFSPRTCVLYRLKRKEDAVLKCSCCGIDLEGWLYYEKGKIRLCHFCYKGLEERGIK